MNNSYPVRWPWNATPGWEAKAPLTAEAVRQFESQLAIAWSQLTGVPPVIGSSAEFQVSFNDLEETTNNHILRVFNVRDYGAVGDGVTNDTAAFQAAVADLNAFGGGTLLIPAATYLVGKQTLMGATGQSWAWRPDDLMRFENCYRPVMVYGHGAKLVVAPGKYGSFDPITGASYTPPAGPFYNNDYRASPINHAIIFLNNSAPCSVVGLEIDGNAAAHTLGGRFGDTGYQVNCTGVWAFANLSVSVQDCHIHHMPQDGLYVGHAGLTGDGDGGQVVTLTNVRSEYNGRQGLSWVGGRVTATNCQFNHTGRGGIISAPAAGLDIEAESSVCWGGSFTGCEFVNNYGSGIVAANANGGHTTFSRCLVWGTTSYAIYSRFGPDLNFENCRIYGSFYGSQTAAANERPNGTRFFRCHMEDKVYPATGTVYREAQLVNLDGCAHAVLDSCHVIGNLIRPIWVQAAADEKMALIRDTIFVFRHGGITAGTYQSVVRSAVLERVRFIDELSPVPTTNYYIDTSGCIIERNVITAARLPWGGTAGTSGLLPRTA